MADGVRVLNTVEHISKLGINTDLIIVFAVCIILGLAAIIFGFVIWEDFYVLLGIFLVIASTLMMVTYISENSKKTTYTYEVLMEDSANIEELLENYEIINIRGEIYEIKEKD